MLSFFSPGFSLTKWESLHGIRSGVSLKVPQVKQLLQDLGVSHLLLDDDKRCDWTATPYSSVNSKGWTDGKLYSQCKTLQNFIHVLNLLPIRRVFHILMSFWARRWPIWSASALYVVHGFFTFDGQVTNE